MSAVADPVRPGRAGLSDIPKRTDWRARCEQATFTVDPTAARALEQAVSEARRSGAAFDTWADYRQWRPVLADARELVAAVRRELEPGVGSGLALLTGFPLSGDLRSDLLAYWALGAQLGVPTSQNAAGDYLVHVKEQEGNAYRGYRSASALKFHCDYAEVTALLCIRPAAEGGENGLVSSEDLYWEIAREAPQLLGLLHQEFPFGRLGEQACGESPVSRHAIAARAQGRPLMWFSHTVIRQAVDGHPDVTPPLSAEQEQLLELIVDISNRPELRWTQRMKAGDVLFVNNTMVLHSREAFRDHGDPALARHSVRYWLEMPDSTMPPAIRHPYRFGNLGIRAW